MLLMRLAVCIFALSSFQAALASELQRFEYSEVAMGVKARIVLYAYDETSAQTAAKAAFERIAYLEDVMSDYRPTSELMRLCAQAGGPPVKVSPELFLLLRKSRELSERTGGAFDVTVGPMVKVWRAARKSGEFPSFAPLREARAKVGWRDLILDATAGTVELKTPGMQLDLGGIAKGYACDEALRVLKRHGIRRALVEMGGDIVVGDSPPDRAGWEIEIPGSDEPLILSNSAISSSGDTEQFVEVGGRRYSHIVDPRTGLGLTNRIAVTVIASDGITSDSLATALNVLGDEKGRELLRNYTTISAYIRTEEEVSPLNTKKPLVLAHYYTWYTTPFGDGGHWGQWIHGKPSAILDRPNDPETILFPPAIREISSCAYPLIGPYDSMNKDVIRWHIRLAKAAGIDAFFVDWWGPATWHKPPGWTHDVLANAVLPIAEEEGFKVLIFDETPQFVDNFETVKEWTTTYLQKFTDSPAWLRIDGKPAWAVYQLWGGKLTAEQGRELIEHVEKEFGPVYWIVDKMRGGGNEQGLNLFVPDDWLAIPQIDCIMGYAMFSTHRIYEYKDLAPMYKDYTERVHKTGKKVLLPVHPGHDNRKIAEEPWVMPRQDGQTLRDFWQAALDAGADFIGITSWNEWPETTIIEPAMTWGDPYQYLKIVAEFQGKKFVAPPLPPLESIDPAMKEYLEDRL